VSRLEAIGAWIAARDAGEIEQSEETKALIRELQKARYLARCVVEENRRR
jgi:hypothetical protein